MLLIGVCTRFKVHFLGNTEMHKGKGSGLQPWPSRLIEPPPRLDEIGVSHDQFQEDTVSI